MPNAGAKPGLDLPFEGELVRAPVKRFAETVIFVHHFGGNKKTLSRHTQLIRSLGFDSVRFNLIFNDVTPSRKPPITADLKFGVRHVWTEQIEGILNSVPGKKIVFSLSMPSNSAFTAIARRQAEDITAFVCDGGPFLQLERCVWNLYTHQFKVTSRILRGVFTGYSLALYGLGFKRELPSLFRQMPKNFPVLAIRGWRDPLVPPSAIEEVFRLQHNLKVEMLDLPKGHHLDGIKLFPEEYADRVSRFLESHATPL